MTAPKHDPLNHAPDQSDTVLLLIDVINDLAFEGGDELLRYALPMAERIVDLRRRAKAIGIPVIYANDNFGRWRSDFPTLVQACLEEGVPGRPIVEMLKPEEEDYFILKPRHSAFYQTNLDILLEYLEAKTIILVGVASDICVLFTANDAYMRSFRVVVPADCVAAEKVSYNLAALGLMRRVLKADTTPSTDLVLPLAP